MAQNGGQPVTPEVDQSLKQRAHQQVRRQATSKYIHANYQLGAISSGTYSFLYFDVTGPESYLVILAPWLFSCFTVRP